MKQASIRWLCFVLLLPGIDLSGQEKVLQDHSKPEGLSIEYGLGAYSQTDRYISKEKYSGTLPYFSAGLVRKHESYLYQTAIAFRYSPDIKNYTVSADITQFSLRQEFLYPMPEFIILSRPAKVFIGPMTEIFVYANDQEIAVSGYDYAQSFAALISLGLGSEMICPLSSRLNLESALNFSVLSLGVRMVDTEETDDSPVKLLTLFAGLHGGFRLGIRYRLFGPLSVRASYLLDYTRITAWNPLHSASDNLILTLTCQF